MKHVVLRFKEGFAQNYLDALFQQFGGDLKTGSYSYRNGDKYIEANVCNSFLDFEMIVVDCVSPYPIRLDRTPDNNPDFLHMVLIKEGGFQQAYSDQLLHIEANSTKGVFFYNGMFPLIADFPAQIPYKSIGFKFSKSTLADLLPESLTQINKMYNSNEGTAYHIPLPPEVNHIIEDIFQFLKGGFGSKKMMEIRGFEAFITVMKAINNMDGDELNGLHINDFKRLMKIKDQIINSLSEVISIEAIAEQFGVSVSKLNRDFKTLFNTTIYKFYTQAKMDEAYRRLKTGQYSVTEVGYDLGYQNLSKFSQMFKKVKGINPKEVIPL